METVTVSPKFRITIPKSVRQSLGIQPGQKLQVINCQNRIELLPLTPTREMRGFIKGIDTSVERVPDRI